MVIILEYDMCRLENSIKFTHFWIHFIKINEPSIIKIKRYCICWDVKWYRSVSVQTKILLYIADFNSTYFSIILYFIFSVQKFFRKICILDLYTSISIYIHLIHNLIAWHPILMIRLFIIYCLDLNREIKKFLVIIVSNN